MVAEVTTTFRSGRWGRICEIAQQKVDVQAALVRLVDDQRVVGLEQRIGLGLGQQMPSVISLTEAFFCSVS
jgi:hypothetical protein